MSASEKLRELNGAATPGPWWASNPDDVPNGWILNSPDGESRGVDGEIIATLRNALPLIADVVEAAEEALAAPEYDWPYEPGAKLRDALTALQEHLDA